MKKFIKRVVAAITVLAFLGLFLCFYALKIEPNMFITTKYSTSTDKTDSALKVVFFCDTHFGKFLLSEKLERIVEKINAQNPDIVIFGGDFVDSYYRDKQQLDFTVFADTLKKIKAKTKLAVLGNHDIGAGAINIMPQMWQDAGFTLLRNQAIVLEEYRIEIIGADDALIGNFTPDIAPQSEYFKLYVCHEPDIASQLIKQDGVMLSGHTHGGQVLLPFLTKKALPRLGKLYRKGEYEVNGSKLFVSSGLGTTTRKIRFLNIPEILVLQINL